MFAFARERLLRARFNHSRGLSGGKRSGGIDNFPSRANSAEGRRPSTGPEKRSAPRAGQRLDGAVASRWRPSARSLRDRTRLLLGASERRVFEGGWGEGSVPAVLYAESLLWCLGGGGGPRAGLPP